MLGQIASSVSQTIYRLGIWYSGYRLIISVSLILIYVLYRRTTGQQLSISFSLFYTLLCYTCINIFQLFFTENVSTTNHQQQLILCFYC